MSFRITTVTDGETTIILLEGRFTIDGVPDLQREIRQAGGSVRLDLSGLTSADADGVRELLDLSVRGTEFRGPSAYIRQLLIEASSPG